VIGPAEFQHAVSPRSSGQQWVLSTAADAGRNPTSPQNDAGMRIEPRMSVPMPKATAPTATSTASPPEEPPQVSAGSSGLLLRPKRGPSVSPAIASSGTLPRASSTAPAARSRTSTAASSVQCHGGMRHEPTVTSRPCTAKVSFRLCGRPASGPASSPATAVRAAASSTSTAPLCNGWERCRRARHSSSSAMGVTSPAPSRASSAVASRGGPPAVAVMAGW
jgi:hypothetical protein